jgi:hypothetical protein
MRIVQEILGTVDRRIGDVQRIESWRDRRCSSPDHLGDTRNDSPARQIRSVVLRKVGSSANPADRTAKAHQCPGDDADEDGSPPAVSKMSW